MASFSVAKCVINNDDTDEELKPVTDEGIATIIRFCTIQNRPDLEEYLNSGPDVVLVHYSCRRQFTDPEIYNKRKTDEQASTSEAGRKLRSGISFLWKKMCFLCGLEADKKCPSVRSASTLPLREKMLENAQERGPDDDWALEVIGR
jgi:hypothetical protein